MYNVGQRIKFNTINLAMVTEGIIISKFKVLDELYLKDVIGQTIYHVQYDSRCQLLFVLENEIEGVL